MSYLHSPRLIFSGDFQSDVSTVNNDTQHYNNETFLPSYQSPESDQDQNGWWNPEGGAIFAFQNCQVRSSTLPNGTILTDVEKDILIGSRVVHSDGKSTGKLLDLDPDMQSVSALWCVSISIYSQQNELLLKGTIASTCFRDLQLRQINSVNSQKNGQAFGGSWTSVIIDISWGENVAKSPVLKALRQQTKDNQLSINLHAFGYYYNHDADGRFSLGRIIGTIGPWFQNEPLTFPPYRRLFGIKQLQGPLQLFAFTNFFLDTISHRITIDFGGSFPIDDALGSITLTQQLLVGVSRQPINSPPSAENKYIDATEVSIIGEVSYHADPDWLMNTGGIVTFDSLSSELLAKLVNNQLLLLTSSVQNPSQLAVLARESVNGYLVRADNFVQRLDNGENQSVDVYAYQWGVSLPNASLTFALEPPTPDSPKEKNQPPICDLYGNNKPADGLLFPPTALTNKHGMAQVAITGKAIHSPRVFLDGQIYSIDYQLTHIANESYRFALFADKIVVHLRDYFNIPITPSWEAIAPTMIQYSNLYPIMSKYLVNLADPVALKGKKEILLFAFTRDINESMHMPVTRDLSQAKRQAIIEWLKNGELPDSKTLTVTANSPSQPKHLDNSIPLSDSHRKYLEAIKLKNGARVIFPDAGDFFSTL